MVQVGSNLATSNRNLWIALGNMPAPSQIVLATGRGKKEPNEGTENEQGSLTIYYPDLLAYRIIYFEKYGIQLEKVKCGTFHTLFLDKKGFVYNLTTNDMQCTMLNNFYLDEQRIELCRNVIISDIAAGRDFSLFLTKNNELFGMGKNDMGQLAMRTQSNYLFEPILIRSVTERLKGQIQKIECGSHFAAVLTNDRRVYCWGNNSDGQVELSPQTWQVVYEPVEIQFLRNKQICQISLGWKHALALSENGELYAFGKRGVHLGWYSTDYPFPMEIDHINQPNPYFREKNISISNISCSANHSYAVSKEGHLYTFGANDFHARGAGQIGLHSEILTPTFSNLLRLTTIPSSVAELACGWHNCICYCKNGSFYAFGENGMHTINEKNGEVETPVPFLVEELLRFCDYHFKCMSAGGQDFVVILEMHNQRMGKQLHRSRLRNLLCDLDITFDE